MIPLALAAVAVGLAVALWRLHSRYTRVYALWVLANAANVDIGARNQTLLAANGRLRAGCRRLCQTNTKNAGRLGDLEDRLAYLYRRLAAEEIRYIDTLPTLTVDGSEFSEN
jgi:hypothetical protein